MAKRAIENDAVDPVRARLAGAVAGAVVETPVPTEAPAASRSELEPPARTPRTTRPRPTREPHLSRPVAKPATTQASVNRKFMVTEQEAERMQEVTLTISRAFGGKVPHTKITRALWAILADHEERIKRMAPGDRRPAPSTGDSDAQAEYEIALHEFLSEFLNRSR